MKDSVIAINIGNTNTQIGLVNIQELSSTYMQSFPTAKGINKIISITDRIKKDCNKNVSSSIKISSVVKSGQMDFVSGISSAFSDYTVSCVHYHKYLPIHINYKRPEALGADRIANCLFGLRKYPGENIIIVDAGTAITVDFLSLSGEFTGGFIFPGITAQFEGLHSKTSQLPHIAQIRNSDTFPPISTQAGMREGIRYCIAGGISVIVQKIAEKLADNVKIISCGGAWKVIENLISLNYTYIPDLTLIGTALFEE